MPAAMTVGQIAPIARERSAALRSERRFSRDAFKSGMKGSMAALGHPYANALLG